MAGITMLLGPLLACGPETGRASPQRMDTSRTDRAHAAQPAGTSRAPARRASRAASALHVVRAPAPALVAGEPLRAPLRVEVYDSRGRPAAGAKVEWRIVSGGGRVTASRDTSDSAGAAEAWWTPGATADPQRLSVSVPDVGLVELSTSVAVATVSVLPRSIALRPRDSASLRASLADAAGHELSGGAPRWESSDTSVAVVSSRGVVIARGAGSARIDASIAGASTLGAAALEVLPEVAGRIVAPAAGPPLPRARLVVRAGGRVDSVDSDDAGRFLVRLRATSDEVTEVLLLPIGPGAERYHPARIRASVPRELGSLGIVLLPTSWTIPTGGFAGRTLPISVAKAASRAGDGSRFWRLERAAHRSTWAAVGWRTKRFPVPVAFRRGGTGGGIRPADSAAFWGVVAALERDLGADLFAPATDPADEELREAVHVAIEPSLDGPGYTLASWNGEGTIGDATIYLRSAALLGDEAIATHELLHTLGVGHTSGWPSLMTPSGIGSRQITAADVAYVQLLLHVRRVQEETDAPYGIVEAATAERGVGIASPPERRDRGRIP